MDEHKNKYVALSVLPILLFIGSNEASAHGWVEFPSARQNTCYLDGGFWTGVLPNQACQEAFDISGAYPFVQRNEVAINVVDYDNMDAVKAAIPDGTLCSAGSSAKAGLNVASSHWQKTSVMLDDNNQFELVFNATAPHNPSFWQFYLSNKSYDYNQPIGWGDVMLVGTAGNVQVGEDRKYRINLTLPEGRTGDAVLYTRWQRNDAAGEGFYNCSDISFSGGHLPPGEETTPDEPEGNYLIDLGYFLTTEFPSVDVDDTVRFRTFNKHGSETNDVRLDISLANQQNWPAVLAAKFNDQKEGKWFVGIWHESMDHYMFDKNNVFANKVYAKSDNPTYQLSLIKGTDPIPPVVDPEPPVISPSNWDKNKVYNDGDIVEHSDKTWLAKWWTRNDEPGTTGEWGVWRIIKNETTPPTIPDTPTVPEIPSMKWQDSKIYNSGDSVIFNGEIWTAYWWTKGEEPGASGEWGVWRK